VLMLIFLMPKIEALLINCLMHRDLQRRCGKIYAIITNLEGQGRKVDLSFVKV
jgi:hypothetical protein